MSLRYSELEQLVTELNASLAGVAVQMVWSLDESVWFELRHRGRAGWRSVYLLVQREPATARISISDEKPPALETPPSFQRWLRQELVAARLTGLTLSPEDRIVRLSFVGERGHRQLVCELTGPGGVLALVGEEDRLYAHAGSAAEGRHLRPGATWQPPPASLPDSARVQPSRLQPDPTAEFPFAEAVEALFGKREKTQRVDQVRRTLTAPLRAKRTRILRTLGKVKVEAARRPDAEEHRRLGELLAQNLFQVPRGAKQVTLTEYTVEGPREVEVRLDPLRTPKQEVDWRFHQYKRLLRGCEAAARRQGELEAELSTVEAELLRLDALTAEELETLVPRAERPKKGERQVAKPYREFFGAKGERILVGKGSKENDTLTFKVARPQDIWLHVRGVPGSHVVVPLERGAELPQELLLDAAHLALHYSQRKGEPTGEVSYTHAKFVRKQKGAPPGAVNYTREKTFQVRFEPSRIDRLLKARDAEPAERGG